MSELFAAGGVLSASAAAAYGLKLLNDVVGPSVKAVGTVFGEFAEYRMRNWIPIGEHAKRMKKPDSSEKSAVHPRVVNKVIEDATWYDDPVMQAYAGGMLASSRSERGDDDRAVFYLDLLDRLPASAVRVHHALYSAIRDAARTLPSPQRGNLREAAWRVPVELLVRVVYPNARGLVPLNEDLSILASLNLIYPMGWGIQPTSDQGSVFTGVPGNTGFELFLAGHGLVGVDFSEIAKDELPEFDPPGARVAGGEGFVDLSHAF